MTRVTHFRRRSADDTLAYDVLLVTFTVMASYKTPFNCNQARCPCLVFFECEIHPSKATALDFLTSELTQNHGALIAPTPGMDGSKVRFTRRSVRFSMCLSIIVCCTLEL